VIPLACYERIQIRAGTEPLEPSRFGV
jgi:hypothetical protein